jgi:hypothetical protein
LSRLARILDTLNPYMAISIGSMIRRLAMDLSHWMNWEGVLERFGT